MSPRHHQADHQADHQMRQIAEDEALLEALARRDDLTLSPEEQDDVTTLLRALTVDVDTHAERATSRPAVGPAVSLLPASQPRPHPMRVRRSTAALGLLAAIVAGGTGVAAAVTGDPFAGLGGLQRVIEGATSGEPQAPAQVSPAAPSSGAPSHQAPGAVPGGGPGGIPGGTLTFAPAPTGPAGTAGRTPEAPGAVLPTTGPAATLPPRQGQPFSTGSPAGPRGAESTARPQQSQSRHEPKGPPTAHPSRPAKSAEPGKPARSPSPPRERPDHSGAERVPANGSGRPGVASSSQRPHEPGPHAKTVPASPVEPDGEPEAGG